LTKDELSINTHPGSSYRKYQFKTTWKNDASKPGARLQWEVPVEGSPIAGGTTKPDKAPTGVSPKKVDTEPEKPAADEGAKPAKAASGGGGCATERKSRSTPWLLFAVASYLLLRRRKLLA
jgi:MYXO-CTERM domain-containing protein